MSKLKPMSDRNRYLFEYALSLYRINIQNQYVLDMICDMYELVRRTKGKACLSEMQRLYNANQQKHSILLSLVPDVYWDVD